MKEFTYTTDLQRADALEILIDHICRTAKRDVEVCARSRENGWSSATVLLTDAEARKM